MYNPWFVQYNRKTLDTKDSKWENNNNYHDCQRPELFNSTEPRAEPRTEILVGSEVTVQHFLFLTIM